MIHNQEEEEKRAERMMAMMMMAVREKISYCDVVIRRHAMDRMVDHHQDLTHCRTFMVSGIVDMARLSTCEKTGLLAVVDEA